MRIQLHVRTFLNISLAHMLRCSISKLNCFLFDYLTLFLNRLVLRYFNHLLSLHRFTSALLSVNWKWRSWKPFLFAVIAWSTPEIISRVSSLKIQFCSGYIGGSRKNRCTIFPCRVRIAISETPIYVRRYRNSERSFCVCFVLFLWNWRLHIWCTLRPGLVFITLLWLQSETRPALYFYLFYLLTRRVLLR
jgi:hypothetical protein